MHPNVLPVLVLFVATSAARLAAQPLEGSWEGAAVARGDEQPMRFHISKGVTTWSGRLDLTSLGVLGWPLGSVTLAGDNVRIEFRSDRGTHRFDGVLAGDSIEGIVRFVGAPEAALTLRRSDPPGSAHEVRQVEFDGDGVRLAGMLTLPPGEGPHPAIVFVHGSGNVTRNAYRYFAHFYADRGVATLAFDKRGTGSSTGDWLEVGFDQLAADVIAGVEYLTGLPEIAAGSIGLQGQSQGGWIAPLAASRSNEVAFVITIVGPLVTPAVEGHWDAEWGLTEAGFGAAEYARAREVLLLRDEAIRTGDGWEAVQTAIDGISGETWFAHTGLPREVAPNPERTAWYGLIMDFDPVPVFEGLDLPILAIFAERDESIPTARSVEILEEIKAAGGKDITIRVFPDANHGMRVGPTADRFRWERYAPGFLEALEDWVAAQTTPR